MRRVAVVMSIGLTVGVAIVTLLFLGLPRVLAPAQPVTAPAPSAPGPTATIRASLFYVSEDGLRLVGIAREVPFGQGTAEQARLLVEAQLQPAPPPLAQAMPPGTALRMIYLTEGGDAFVDLSGEVTSAHAGGSLNELFSVYAIVNALTVNLPAISRVQILVDGKEVDTLAGHVDLRQPLRKNLKWAQPAQTEPSPTATAEQPQAGVPPR